MFLLAPASMALRDAASQALEPPASTAPRSAAAMVAGSYAPAAAAPDVWDGSRRRNATAATASEPPRDLLASIAARTRITAHPAEVGAKTIHVKMSSGFQAGARVRINPGGATEEDNVLAHVSSFVLERPLRHMHGLGETVLQLGGGAAIERISTSVSKAAEHLQEPQPRPQPQPQPQARPEAPLKPQPQPLRPTTGREPPLVGSVPELLARASLFVHGHWGVETAAVLVAVMVATLFMAGYLIRVFCDYSLCCLWRTKQSKEIGMDFLTSRSGGDAKDAEYRAVKAEYF